MSRSNYLSYLDEKDEHLVDAICELVTDGEGKVSRKQLQQFISRFRANSDPEDLLKTVAVLMEDGRDDSNYFEYLHAAQREHNSYVDMVRNTR